METFAWNRQCLLRDGKPWFPVMGEFHYTRYPEDRWREEVAKMIAGGVTIVSTYVFWLHHEPEEGVFDFSGRRSLRGFLQACRDEGVYVWIRIGPWCHGEAKNGGFPDWLMQKDWQLRSNDPRYLERVRLYWQRVAAEVDGFLYGQGGMVIGTQLENEYGHCGGAGDPAHMDALLRLAKELGIRTPYYSATGWGGAVLDSQGEILPVMGAYCEAPWDRATTELPANGNYLLSKERNDVDIGADFRLGEHLTFDPDRYPFLTAELAGGMAGTYHRRPYVTAGDIGAMSLCKLGSGAALLGYYMYHGGTNPGPGLHESRATGGNCDWPELSYDGRTAIREYGQISANFKEIKLLAMFLQDYGERLAGMETILPDVLPASAEDMETPRYAWRTDGKQGFLFVNNYQRRRKMSEKTLRLQFPMAGGEVRMPPIPLKDGDFALYPVRMPLGDAVLESALATPLCSLNGKTFVFYTDGDPAYQLQGEADILTISRADALDAYKIERDGREALVVSDAPLVRERGQYRFFARGAVHYAVYLEGTRHWTGALPPAGAQPKAAWREQARTLDACTFEVRIEYPPQCADCYLQIDYEGAKAEMLLDGVKVADDFYDGHRWEIGMERFDFPSRVQVVIHTLREDEPVYFDRPPAFQDGRASTLKQIGMGRVDWVDLPPVE